MTHQELQHLSPYAGFLALCRNEHTRVHYTQNLRMLREFLAGKNPCEISKEEILAFAATLDQEGVTPSGKSRRSYATATVLGILATVKSFYRYLCGTDQVSSNPADALALLRIKKPGRLPRALHPVARMHLLNSLRADTIPNTRRSLAVRLGFECGLRISETSTIRKDDLNLEQMTVRVLGKGDKERVVPMTEGLRNWLKFYFDLCPSRSPYLFPHQRDPLKPVQTKIVNGWFKLIGSWAGIENLTGHVLRHTFATQLAETGATAYEIRDLLGHATIQQTETYVKLASTAARDAHSRAFSKGGTFDRRTATA